MTELIELISKITVLVAALAGISAINKWKRERFDKAKIESIEEYESCLRKINKKIDSILNESPISFCLDDEDNLNNNYTQLDLFWKRKEKSIEELRSEIDSSEHFFDVYSGYAGNNLVFVNNYYQTTFLRMERAVVKLEMELLQLDIDKCKGLTEKGNIFLFDLLKDEKNEFDYEDYMMMSYITYLKGLKDFDEDFFKDKRIFYGNSFKRIVSAEKMALHASFIKRVLIKLNIFFMKYKLIGKVLHMTDRYAVIVSVNGAINVIDTKGNDLDEIEIKNRKNIFKRMIRVEASRLFS